MMMADGDSGHVKMRLTDMTSRDQDIHKGGMEDARPTEASNAPGQIGHLTSHARVKTMARARGPTQARSWWSPHLRQTFARARRAHP